MHLHAQLRKSRATALQYSQVPEVVRRRLRPLLLVSNRHVHQILVRARSVLRIVAVLHVLDSSPVDTNSTACVRSGAQPKQRCHLTR